MVWEELASSRSNKYSAKYVCISVYTFLFKYNTHTYRKVHILQAHNAESSKMEHTCVTNSHFNKHTSSSPEVTRSLPTTNLPQDN